MAVKIEMDMPKSCSKCRFGYYSFRWGLYGYKCKLDKELFNDIPRIRNKMCPLQSIESDKKLPKNSACYDCALTADCLWLKKQGPCSSCGSKKLKEVK